MSTTTPLLPVELPPFSLIPLISPIFTVTPPSNSSNSPQTSPSKSSFNLSSPSSPPSNNNNNNLGRLTQLASNTLGLGGGLNAVELNKLPIVRSVESSEEIIWVGGSDGRMRIYEIGEISGPSNNNSRLESGGEGSRSSTVGLPFENYSSPRRGSATTISSNNSENGSPIPITGLDLLQEVVVTQGRKAADRIALLERLGKAVILSEGILTFHSLPSLNPLPVHSFPSMKGVTTFSLDEEELAGGGSKNSMHICAIKRRTMHVLLVTNEGVTTIKELPLKGGALLSVFRRNIVCIADAMNYSIVDMVAAISTPLLPISQSPNTDERPLSTTADSSSPSSTTPPSTAAGIAIDPRQRPAVACIGNNEFLIASHTGSTTLGVFINEQGEPCRGTLEWGSNLRSLTIDDPYVVALLYNNTIEIHSSMTLEIVQVIPLPTSTSPYSLQPRSLIHSWSGLNLNGEANNKIQLVNVPMFKDFTIGFDLTSTTTNDNNDSRSSTPPPPPSTLSNQTTPKKTPTRRQSSTRIDNVGSKSSKGKEVTKARTLVVGKNSLLALAPWTLVAQADALFDKGRSEDAIALAKQIEGIGSKIKNPEVAYVYLRAAYISLRATLFQEAFELFLKSNCDPRIIVRMFPDLRNPLLRSDEILEVFLGISSDVEECLSIDQFIMANLTHNYSPHMKPNVESASPTKGLRTSLGTTARDCLRIYLDKWRLGRRNGRSGGSGDSRKVDMVVDTTLVQLLAEEGKETEILKILDGPNDCVLQQVEPTLLESGLYQLQASIHLKRGEISKALDIWTKIVEGEYVDKRYTGGVEYIFELLWESKDKFLVEKYGIWVVGQDRNLGLKLFTDPSQTHTFDARSLFAKLRAFDGDAADLFLESVVLQKRDTDSRLHSDLVKRYVDRLGELLADPATKLHLREQESAYITLVSTSSTSSPATFLSFLTSRYDPTSPHANFDLARLKTILFLSTSANYDIPGTKKDLEDMELKGLRGLTLERAVVYGKLKLDRQALSLLLHTLQDLSSAETYCQQSGDPLLASNISATAALLSFLMPSSRKRSVVKKDGEEERKVDLARLLVSICLSGNGIDESAIKMEHISRILEAQSVNLDTLSIIPLLPSKYPLSLFTPFLKQSLRRSLHFRHETSLLKSLASSQNSEISEKLGDLQVKLGGILQTSGPILGVDGKEEVVKLIEKLDGSEKEKEEVIDVELDLM